MSKELSLKDISEKLDEILEILKILGKKEKDEKEKIIYESESLQKDDDFIIKLNKYILDNNKDIADFKSLIGTGLQHKIEYAASRELLVKCMMNRGLEFARCLIEQGLVNIKVAEIVCILFRYKARLGDIIELLVEQHAWPYDKMRAEPGLDQYYHPINVFIKYLKTEGLAKYEISKYVETFSTYVDKIKENISRQQLSA
jgi:hypothetical protein